MGRPAVRGWLDFFGVCFHEFSPWEAKSAEYSRLPDDIEEQVLANNQLILFTKKWQERRCLHCGKIQQQALRW